MQKSIKAYIHRGEKYYVGECIDIPVVTQGMTIDEVVSNLQEAISLHFEEEDPSDYDLIQDPSILVTMEIDASLRHVA